MIRYRREVVILGVLVTLLSGCSTNSIPEMTDEETQMVEEYAAQLLLKYDANYECATLTEEEKAEAEEKLQKQAQIEAEIQAQKEAEEAQQQEADNSTSDNSTSGGEGETANEYTDIDEFLELSGLEINYVDYQVCSSYPSDLEEDDWQGVARATGTNQLVVFQFSISNQSGADYFLDMASKDTRFTIRINGSITKTAITTLLADDMIMYRGTIPNGETVNAVMLIEMSPEDAAAIDSAVLVMKYNGQRAETTLL